MNQVELAEMIATWAHRSQVDKVGRPYIEHPRRVAKSVGDQFEGPQAVAWLHDVVEDTDISLDDLLSLGVDPVYVQCVDNLTKRPGEKRSDAIRRAMLHPISHWVKIHDNADNSSAFRTQLLNENDRERLTKKYSDDRRLLFSIGTL